MQAATTYYEARQGEHPDPAWIINYDAERAADNFHYLTTRMREAGEAGEPRVYVSRDCAAVVISNGELDAIREPHVRAWRESFIELNRKEFLQRVTECRRGERSFLGGPLMAACAA